MTTINDLGVSPLINANATLTSLGGSLMPESVIEAMARAATSFVDMFALQEAVSRRLADLTHNEAALVVSGASAGILVSVLGAMTGTNYRMLGSLLEQGAASLPRNEVVMQRGHRIPYDNVVSLAGARIVEVGNAIQTFRWELEAAINDRTAAILHVAGSHLEPATLHLETVVGVAQERNVPVIVDAAAQLPPRENLWGFTQAGADLALFSGGKELRGPQSTGLIVGTAQAVESCAMHTFPHQRFGRPAKVGKEEMMGLLAAVEWWLDQDLEAIARRIELHTREWISALDGVAGARASRDYPSEAGRPFPRVLLSWDTENTFTGGDLAACLRNGYPGIDIAIAGAHSVWLNAELLTDAEVGMVTRRVRECLTENVTPPQSPRSS